MALADLTIIVHNRAARGMALTVHILAILPGLNWALCALAILLMSLPVVMVPIGFWFQPSMWNQIWAVFVTITWIVVLVCALCCTGRRRSWIRRYRTAATRRRLIMRMLFYSQMIALVGILWAFINHTESMISDNEELTEPGDTEWGFGQALSLVLVIPTLMDAIIHVRKRLRENIGKSANAGSKAAQSPSTRELDVECAGSIAEGSAPASVHNVECANPGAGLRAPAGGQEIDLA